MKSHSISSQFQAKKNGQEMPAQDVMELERANQEVSVLNKQLDQMKKQRTKHLQLFQEYRNKQQVRRVRIVVLW